MKALHLFANHKWTGPAEPALNLCLALRALGVDVSFACSPGKNRAANRVIETALDRGLTPILSLNLSKHRNPIKNFVDRRTLRAILAVGDYDVVHCHLQNDHRIAVAPAAKVGVPLIRTSYEGEGLPAQPDTARLVAGASHIIEPSRGALETDLARFDVPPERMSVIPGAVDTERFDPRRELPDGRRWLKIPPDAFVIGIIARMQLHRHFEDLWEVARRLIRDNPKVHVLVVGRGTNQEIVGKEPVRKLGIEKNVHFPGYIDGENYVGMLKAFDLKVFLVPGSDGTCRAVREAMAMSKPCVVANRGVLPEIIDNENTGIVFDNTPEALYQALVPLTTDRPRVHELGQAARKKALEAFSLPVHAQAVLNIYESLLR